MKIFLYLMLFAFIQASYSQINAYFMVNGDTINQHPFVMCKDSCFNFSIAASGGMPPYTYLWNNGSTDEITTYCTANMSNYQDTIMVTVADLNSQTNSFHIWAPNYININQEICIVTVDSTTKKNMIIWEQNTDTTIMFYNIYKESTTLNQFHLIGGVLRDSLSLFIDTTSIPEQVSARYIIAASDGCAESILSSSHKTMHLAISPGINNTWNLNWSNYQGWNYPTKNRIWRGSVSSGLELIDSVASSITSYTDLYPPNGTLYYAVEMLPHYMCNPSSDKGSLYTSSFSNTVDNIDYLGIGNAYSDIRLKLSPNPVRNMLYIISDVLIECIEIRDITGRIVCTTTSLEIDCSSMNRGVYFFRGLTNNTHILRKFIKL